MLCYKLKGQPESHVITHFIPFKGNRILLAHKKITLIAEVPFQPIAMPTPSVKNLKAVLISLRVHKFLIKQKKKESSPNSILNLINLKQIILSVTINNQAR
jgi:hypothetical protein